MFVNSRILWISLGLLFTGIGVTRAEDWPTPVLLWPEGAPGAVGQEDVDKPSIRIYRATQEKASQAAVVICPGGGYAVLATDHEGHQVAKFLNTKGITAVVLKSRLGRRYQHPAPLSDAQRAIRYVRAHAEEWKISPDRVGIMGFSAGGHLASTAATHFDAGKPDSADPLEKLSSRPDFAILGYPVISFVAPYSHSGSARNLLGEKPDPELLNSLSNDTQVTPQTPPTFLFHTGEDTGVPVENSVSFYMACRKHKVPAEMHIYQHGPHGVGLAPGDAALNTWKDHVIDWLRVNGLLEGGERKPVKGSVNFEGKPLRWGQIRLVSLDSPYTPQGFAMISQGKYSLSAERGVYPGRYQVQVYHLGGVEPQPTIADAKTIVATEDGVVVQVQSGDNTFDLNVK